MARKKAPKKAPETHRRNPLSRRISKEEAQIQAILNSTADGILTISDQGLVQSLNAAAERLFGYQSEEVIGRNVMMLMPSPYREEHDSYLSNYLRTGVAKILGREREVEGLRKDGSKFPLALRVTEMRHAGERVFIGTVQDISERKRAEAKVAAHEAQIRAILNATADGILTIDERGMVQSLNAAAERLFGYRPEEVIGRNITLLMPSPYREEHDGYLGNYLRTGVAKIIGKEREVEGLRRDGSKFALALRVTELRQEDKCMFIGTVQDISERKRKALEGISDTVAKLSAASAQILASTTQHAAGIQEQAGTVSQTVATVDEVTQTAEQSAQRAKGVGDAVQRTLEIGQAGRKAVEESITALGMVQEKVEATAENILALAEQAQAIGEITATVKDIAEQTNLLALNAAIEASRAGEHGRGFAVVAAEVKILAEQSKKATAQVRQILGEIQKATNTTVLSTEEVTKGVAAAVKVASQAGATIKALTDTLAAAAQAAAQIVASAGQQATGMAQIHQAMKNIEQVARQNVAAMHQAEQAAQDLNALGARLRALSME